MKPVEAEDYIYHFEPAMRPAVGWYFFCMEGRIGPFDTEEDARIAYAEYQENLTKRDNEDS